MSGIDFKPDEKLWVEKYRPRKVADTILKPSVKKEFQHIVDQGHIPNLLLYGPPGTGKTTVARAMCEELGLDYTIVNASNERGLDVIRDKVTSFASTVSMTGNGKCFILDEADHLMPATQAALRAASEELSKACSFVMTANYPNRIIDALHSRFVGIDFGVNVEATEKMQAQMYVRCMDILNNESIEFDDRVLIQIIQKLFPDNRKILGKLQHYGRHGKIDTGILMELEEVSIDSLVSAIRNRKFKDITKWAADNANNDTSIVYEKIYKKLKEFVKPDSLPDAISVLEDYQRFDQTVASKELHLAALGTELMTSLEFK